MPRPSTKKQDASPPLSFCSLESPKSIFSRPLFADSAPSLPVPARAKKDGRSRSSSVFSLFPTSIVTHEWTLLSLFLFSSCTCFRLLFFSRFFLDFSFKSASNRATDFPSFSLNAYVISFPYPFLFSSWFFLLWPRQTRLLLAASCSLFP